MAFTLKSNVAVRPSLRAQAPRVALPMRARVMTRATVDKVAVLEDVRGIIAEQLGTDLEKVTAEAKFVDLGADSLDTVEIMMALEEKFDLHFGITNTLQ